MAPVNAGVKGSGVLSFSMLLLVAVAVVPVVSFLTSLSVVASLSLAVAAICILFPVSRRRDLRLDAFHPYSYLAFTSIQTFLIPAVLFAEFRYGATPLNSFTRAVMLIGAAHAFITVGFLLPFGYRLGHRLPLLRWKTGVTRWRRIVPVASFVYVVGWLARIQRGSLGFSHLPGEFRASREAISILGDLGTMATLSYVVLLGYLFQRTRVLGWPGLVVALLVGIEMLAGALEGGRTGIVFPIVYALLAWRWSGRPVRITTLLGLYLLALLLLGPILTAYRLALYERIEGDSIVSPSIVLAAALETPATIERSGGMGELRRVTINQRAPTFESTLRVIDRVPDQYAFEWGGGIVADVATLVVPRAVWSGKPVYDVGQRRAAEFWNIDRRLSRGTSIAVGMPAEIFLNFSWWGLPLFAGFGLLVRSSASWLSRLEEDNVARLVLTAFVAIYVSQIGQDIPSYAVGLLRNGLVYFGFLVLLHGRLPSVHGST
jgi:hypothetical protein